MQRLRNLVLLPCLVLSVPACDEAAKGDGGDDEKKQDAAEKAEDGAQAPTEAAAGKTFDDGLKKRGCELLTAEMVSKALEVPAGDLTQMKVLGCSYEWEGEGRQVEAAIRFIRVYDDVEKATQWFSNMTKDQTPEEIAAAMEQIKKKVKEDGKIQGAGKEAVTDVIGGALTGSMPEGVSYVDVPGVGDEARASEQNGDLYVRVGNATFTIHAYAGKAYVPPPLDPTNLQAAAKAQQKAVVAWEKETASEHQKAAVAVAKLVVAAM